MTSFAFISEVPCVDCDSRRIVRAEPPYELCRSSLYGDAEPLDEQTGEGCKKLAAVEELSDMAVEAAERWQVRMRHTPAEVRAEQVRGFSDLFHDWARDIGAEFDDAAFVGDCTPKREEAAA